MSSIEASLRMETVFDALDDDERRLILAIMGNEGEVETVNELINALTKELEADEERIVVRLYHRHLPLLDEHGIIDWEADTGSIEQGESFDSVYEFTKIMCDADPEMSIEKL